ncbi:OmpA family protein [Flavisolibacter ginsenosidimutans]|uniref:OmpA family protein n=1 Tax=Flavisolibacter ginsenosidimutans TaxID=661481 RepID=A0A5B8UJY8_9BACT|nr:OmpA family protein [Flavisolibacter ginsenosidimutans]QEC56873.1 OmpA family protein [Flavisolibacter ginsenosidimutans]
MKNLFVFLFFCSFLSASAQYDVTKIDRKAVALYERALQLTDANSYKESIPFFQQAIARDERYVDAYLSLAGVYGQLKDYDQSVAFYEKAFALDTAYTSDYWLPYSINLAGKGDFEKALQTVNKILAKPNLHPTTKKAAEYRQKCFQFAVDYAKTHPTANYVFAPKNLGDAVNSSESEYFPSMPVDGKILVFTRRLHNANEDFFASEKTATGWTNAVPLPGNINTSLNEGAQNISQDGTLLVFTACNRQDGQGNCDIYYSQKTNYGWSPAFNLGPNVNTDQWESQPCLSPDKRDLYFASRRFGGYGGSDLYVSHKLPSGNWSKPENLGPEINTAGDESSPFIHADNQTLYFASSGLPGYGSEDLFVVRKGADGKWGKPENLGYPINTIDHEGTLFIEADGKTAYYASDRSDSKGGLDIYSFELRQDVRPARTLWVKGKVFDKKTSAGLPSSVELIDLATKQIISKLQTDETGNYLITLPVGKDYAFNVARRGYLFYSDNYSLKNKAADSTYQKDIPLQPIEVDAAVVLRNLFFDTKKFDIKPESEVELEKVVQLLQENPTVKIQIEGHTDNVGSAADNQKLSETRARSVVNYLIEKGIRPERLVAKGFGATKPIADNKTEEGRAMNRRTELKVIAK